VTGDSVLVNRCHLSLPCLPVQMSKPTDGRFETSMAPRGSRPGIAPWTNRTVVGRQMMKNGKRQNPLPFSGKSHTWGVWLVLFHKPEETRWFWSITLRIRSWFGSSKRPGQRSASFRRRLVIRTHIAPARSGIDQGLVAMKNQSEADRFRPVLVRYNGE